MARIKDESVERVKATVEILPLVEDVVRLRKSGGTYKGLCPFHSERTPSFTVSPARGTFKCFGCGEGGDAITFVEKTENVDFVGAIELLARRFGVELEYEEASPEQEQKRRREDRLRALLERAAEFYARVLWDSDAGGGAREYLASRGLGEDVCGEFRLGYAPGGARLASRALQEGYTQDGLRAVGLANSRGNDYFQRRIVFPLADARRRVRGFQARKLHDDDPLQAKYVNSPEGELFRKGDLLYGLDAARQAIAREDRAVVVEGNTDVIALRQAEFAPVVASMGTALTEAQLRELARLTKRLFLCFDADAAGQDATLRGMELAVAQGLDVKIVTLAPRSRSSAAGVISPRLLDAGQRLERSVLAGVAGHESLLPDLELLGPDHFDDELHRRARGYLLGQEAADGELTGLLAELYALQDEEEITLETASQLLLRLRERGLQRELANADDERLVELQQALSKLRDEIRAFA